jgi:hypothetical protein
MFCLTNDKKRSIAICRLSRIAPDAEELLSPFIHRFCYGRSKTCATISGSLFTHFSVDNAAALVFISLVIQWVRQAESENESISVG